jgi:nitrate reductase delta subunit
MRIHGLLADLIDYPQPDLMRSLDQCMASSSGEINSLLGAFRAQVQEMGRARLEEHYIEIFDFHAEASPYVGHHLFGEDIRRSLFMAQLRERYRQTGLPDRTEVPDHLAEILRFLAAKDADGETVELIHRCLIPAVEHMLRGAKITDNPYPLLVRAILLVLRQEDDASLQQDDIAWIPYSSSSSPTSR